MSNIVRQEYVKSSGNIFADMGLDNADELLLRAQLGYSVRQILKHRNLTQQDVAKILEIQQLDALSLMQGQYHLFSEGCLLGFLNKLDHKVTINISPRQLDEPLQQVIAS